jgi:hypothetical protein
MRNSGEIFSFLGDMNEEYTWELKNNGKRNADLWYWKQVFISFPSFVSDLFYWSQQMIKNYLLTTLRIIKRHKGYSFINIFGLAVGMACFLLIFLWIQNETSYDRFHEKRDAIYKAYSESRFSDGRIEIADSTSFYPLARVLREECPEIVDALRYHSASGILIRFGDKQYVNNQLALADPTFFDLFTFPLIKGDPESALTDKSSIVLTERMSEKYFGTEDPMGKILNVLNEYDLQVTGIMEDPPKNSSLQFDCVVPFVLMFGPAGTEPDNWGGNPLTTFVQLQNGISEDDAEAKMTDIALTHRSALKGGEWKLHLQPLSRLHLYSPQGGGLISSLTVFSIIACVVLIIACINFMNLSTARAGNRACEVGLRKVVGAKRGNLIRQFLGESILFSFTALIFAVLLVSLFLPVFNSLLGKQMLLSELRGPVLWLVFLGTALLTGLFSGLYPALVLSSYQPVKVIKGSLTPGSKGSTFRKVLVIGQFAISIFLIICTLVIYKQLGFVMNIDMGFDRENLVFIFMGERLKEKYGSVKSELLNDSHVLNVTKSVQHPAYIGSTVSRLDWDGKNPDERQVMNFEYVGHDYFETFGMDIVEGRPFSKEIPTDATAAYIVNQEAAELMQMEDPVGQRLSVFGKEGRIIGVVKDFHFKPLHHKIQPLVIGMDPDWESYMFVRISPEDSSGTLGYIKDVCERFDADYPAFPAFFNERWEAMYSAEDQMKKISGYATFLAVLISCLGLFGLASFMAQQRTKEIGIRKVLGASVSGIVFMFSKEFSKLVLIANIISWPLAYFIAKKWMENYAYRASIGIEIFILSAATALATAFLTVGYQSLKAALSDPADTLKYE